MTTKILLTVLTFFSYQLLFSQSVEIYLDGGSVIVTNQSHTITLNEPNSMYISDHIVDFEFKNISDADQSWIITREIINEPTDWSNRFCFGKNGDAGLCMVTSGNQYQSSSVTTISEGEYISVSTYVVAPIVGSGTYRYHYSLDGQNFLGHVDLIVDLTTSIDDKSQSLTFNIGPNPVSSNLKIYSSVELINCKLDIYDAMGNMVKSYTKFNNNSLICTEDLPNGMYIISLNREEESPILRKIIVKH